jgi:hypothetical protein
LCNAHRIQTSLLRGCFSFATLYAQLLPFSKSKLKAYVFCCFASEIQGQREKDPNRIIPYFPQSPDSKSQKAALDFSLLNFDLMICAANSDK